MGFPSVLSGNPKLTPNSGYTYLFGIDFDILPKAARSSASKSMIVRFCSIRDGLTDFARTEWPNATVSVSTTSESTENKKKAQTERILEETYHDSSAIPLQVSSYASLPPSSPHPTPSKGFPCFPAANTQ
jgi:hypothetical protein